jgi:uncharacterized protein YecT (DUF1311 family)
MRKWIVSLLFLLTATPSFAAHDSRGAALAAANAGLNAEYQKIVAQENSADKTALRDLERAWIAFKDKQCLFEDGGAGGQVQKPGMPTWPNYADCEIRVTNARTQELKGLECQGASVCAVHPEHGAK